MSGYGSSYSTEWRLLKMNEDTWAPSDLVEGFKSAQINRDGTDECPLLESGTIVCDRPVGKDLEEGWYKIEARASFGGTALRLDVATLLLYSTQSLTNRFSDAVTLKGSSVLKPAADRKMLKGSYIPKGVDGAEYVHDLLTESISAPVVVDGSFTIDDYVVLQAGTSYLKAAWLALDAAAWCMQIDGDGTVHICPKPSKPDLVLDNANAKLLQPSITRTVEYGSVPNFYYADDGEQSAYSINEDPYSPTSTISRHGRRVDVYDESPVRVNGETLSAYTARKLEEQSTIVKTHSYNREYVPGIVPFSLVRGTMSSVGLEGDMRVMSQTLVCDKGIHITEKAGLEIVTWTA